MKIGGIFFLVWPIFSSVNLWVKACSDRLRTTQYDRYLSNWPFNGPTLLRFTQQITHVWTCLKRCIFCGGQLGFKLIIRSKRKAGPLWPDWAIYRYLGNFLKPLATINLPKSPTILGNFCKGDKIFHFCIEIGFGQLLQTFGDFLLVTLGRANEQSIYLDVYAPST